MIAFITVICVLFIPFLSPVGYKHYLWGLSLGEKALYNKQLCYKKNISHSIIFYWLPILKVETMTALCQICYQLSSILLTKRVFWINRNNTSKYVIQSQNHFSCLILYAFFFFFYIPQGLEVILSFQVQSVLFVKEINLKISINRRYQNLLHLIYI